MTEALLNKPCWVIDILPEQVPKEKADRYFAVEKYYLQPSMMADLHRRFTNILLKLNCYSDFLVSFTDSDREICNPSPNLLASWINSEEKDLIIVLSDENTLITLNHDDTCMTVFNPSGVLLNRLNSLASAGGLFLWQPPKEPA